MTDKVVVRGLECVVAIGVSAEERAVPQRLSIDIEISTDTRQAARTDSLEDAIDYGPIVAMVVRLVSGREYRLIERLAEDVAAAVLAQHGGEGVRVVVRKVPPPLAAPLRYVAVEVERKASETS